MRREAIRPVAAATGEEAPGRAAKPLSIAIAINSSWNIHNFRMPLVRALQADGHEVAAIAPTDAYTPRLAAAGLAIVPLAMDPKGVSPLADALLFARYLSALRRLRPDVLLCYTAKPNIYGSLAAQALGIAVVNNVAGLGTAFIRKGPLTAILTALYRRAFRGSRRVFFQNEEDRDLFVAERIVAPAKAGLLPGSGIDLEAFAPAPSPERPGRPFTFLLIGRLLRDKGVLEYVEAARAVRRSFPETCFQLLGFLGAENRTAIGPSEVDAWVREGVVEYLGASDDVRPFIAAADCVVLPSYREGLPRALLEGAAMARPLIATDVEGCRAVVEDGVNGFLCAARSAEALGAAMRRMLQTDAAARAALAAAGRRKAEAEFDQRIVIERYRRAIAEAVALKA
ncbi:MAG: glycosyltransferase family 4 protein [Allosphingosinicella sp.]